MLLQPVENEMVISKKPFIKCQIQVPYDMTTLYIELDWTDMSSLIKLDDTGFELKPVQVLASGEHTLLVSFMDNQGQEITREFKFSSRQTRLFDQADSQNQISVVSTNILEKMDDAKDQGLSDWVVESSLYTSNVIAEGPWRFSLESNLQHFDQERAAAPPLEKGIEIRDYKFSGQYEKGSLSARTDIGDITVDESRNTVSGLSRRGGSAGIEYGPVYADGFVVRSDQAFGLDGDEGLDLDNADHIYGSSGGLRLFSERVNMKAVYVTGGEAAGSSSYGIWPDSGGSGGEAYGMMMTTNLFENRLETFFEWDSSRYDSDISDSTASIDDKAWLGKINGRIDWFDYTLEYEYTGPDYQVPGNSSIQPDRKGYTASTQFSFENQSISAGHRGFEDNVEDRPARQTLETDEYTVDYHFDGIPSLPVSFGWSQLKSESSYDPSGTEKIHTVVNQYRSGITWNSELWSVGVEGDYSYEDDRTGTDYDTSSKGARLSASYSGERISLSPSYSFNRFKDHSTGIETDTSTTGLAVFFNIYKGLTLEGNGNYTHIADNADTADQDEYSGNLQLAYNFESPVKGFLSPGLLLWVEHRSSKDKIADSSSGETIVYLVLTADLNLSF